MWYVFFLVVIGVTGVFIWDYRRKVARREAVSKERFEQIFKAKAAAAAPDATSSPAVPAAVMPAAVPTPKASPVAPLAVRERFLGQPETLIYLLLKTGIPDHEVFANVSLASVVGVPGKGYERERQLRRLSPHQIDFVVCDRSLRIVAVVEVESDGRTLSTGEQSFKEECLRSGGIRLVRIHPATPPRRDEIRKLVCGSAEPVGR